jgi:hypothetical protein
MGSRMSQGPPARGGASQGLPRGVSPGIAAGLAILTTAALLATLRHQSWSSP